MFPVHAERIPCFGTREIIARLAENRRIFEAFSQSGEFENDIFPVNSHLTGNIRERPVRSGLHRAPGFPPFFRLPVRSPAYLGAPWVLR